MFALRALAAGRGTSMPCSFRLDQWTQSQWDAMVDSFDWASLYQRWQFGEIRSRGSGRSVSRAALLDDSGRPLVMAQFRIKRLSPTRVGVAEADWGPLLHYRDEIERIEQPLRMFLEAARRHYCTEQGLEVRLQPRSTIHPEKDARLVAILESCGYRRSPHARIHRTYVLDTSQDIEQIRKNFHQKWRNQLNAALKADLRVDCGCDDAYFNRFGRLFTELVHHKRFSGGLPTAVVREMMPALAAEGRLFIHVAADQHRDLAASICVACGDTLLYLFGASSMEARRSGRPGYLLQWKHIHLARSLGMRWYDTGGLAMESEELNRFKQRMGGHYVVFPGQMTCTLHPARSWLYRVAESGYRGLMSLRSSAT